MTVCAMTFTSCSGGADHSDPKSVAEKALSCYHNGDYATLKTLINPNDKNGLEEMDQMIELSKKFKESHPDYEVKAVDFTFDKMAEYITGAEVSPTSDDVIVYFKSEVYPRQVEVIKGDDGKWYFERFK